jgi:ABC-type glycerol-3-phosphate transport system substrate-binding protein
MLWTNGGNLYDDAGKAALTSPEALETYQFLQDLVLEDETAILSGTTEGVDFLGGNLAFQFWGNWIIGWYDFAMEDPYGVVPVPVQKDEAIIGGIDGYVFLTGSANPGAGWEVAKWLSSYEGQKVLNDEDEVEVISVNKLAAAEAYDNPNFSVPEEAKDWIPSAAFTITRFNPWVPVGPGFDYPTAFEGIFLGDSVEDTLAQISADVDALNESTPSYG